MQAAPSVSGCRLPHQHPYIAVWYDESEVNGPQPRERYDSSIDESDHTVEQWKDLIYREVSEYEATHLLAESESPSASPPASPPPPPPPPQQQQAPPTTSSS